MLDGFLPKGIHQYPSLAPMAGAIGIRDPITIHQKTAPVIRLLAGILSDVTQRDEYPAFANFLWAEDNLS